ncbi:MAG: winged helix-turn-helix transcriptional regulator [Candidatus Aenigmarchaeota archaeon]|nr:winged helix-turn-helix transcriptional regulator [Candidatus Aenigmarchaeota archaeon]
MEKQYMKYIVVMLLCFLFGGFSLIFYLLQVYSVVWQADLVSEIRQERGNFSIPVLSTQPREGNISGFDRRPPTLENNSLSLFSPFSLILLFTGIISLLAGFSIWNLVREKEIKSAKKTVLDALLLPEEKKVMDEIENHGGSLRQNEIARNTGFSRVKVHRIVRNLEKKNLILKQQYGMTNKITIKR